MKKVLEKVINGITVVIAVNDNNELKIGSQSDFENRQMRAFVLGDDMWYGVDLELIHTGGNLNDTLYCNIGIGLPENNTDFPFEFITPSEAYELQLITGEV